MDFWSLAGRLDRWSRFGIAVVLAGLGLRLLPSLAPSLAGPLAAHAPYALLVVLGGAALIGAQGLCRLAILVIERRDAAKSRRAAERQRRAAIDEGLRNLTALSEREAGALRALLDRPAERFLLPPDLASLRDKRIVFVETLVFDGDSVYGLNPAIAERADEIRATLAARSGIAGRPAAEADPTAAPRAGVIRLVHAGAAARPRARSSPRPALEHR